MERPKDAPWFLSELSTQIERLDSHSDVLALGYLSEIYHISATYGLVELQDSIPEAFRRIYDRYHKNDPVRLHYLISMLSRLPAKYSADIFPELDAFVTRLSMPDITRLALKALRMNLEEYKNGEGA